MEQQRSPVSSIFIVELNSEIERACIYKHLIRVTSGTITFHCIIIEKGNRRFEGAAEEKSSWLW